MQRKKCEFYNLTLMTRQEILSILPPVGHPSATPARGYMTGLYFCDYLVSYS